MHLKPDQERVCTLLKETITLMCKNGLTFNSKFCIDAVIGVTLDEKECFLINLNEVVKSDKETHSSSDSEGGACLSSSKRKRKRKRHVKKEECSGDESGSDGDYGGQSSPAKRNNGHQEEEDDDDNAIVFVKQEPKMPWSESSCQYETQDNLGQSTSQMHFQDFPDPSQDPDLSFGDSAFLSGRTQPRSMGHPSQTQAISPYTTTSAVTGLGQAHDASFSQISQFRISSTPITLRKDVSKLPEDCDDLSQFMASLPVTPKGQKSKVSRYCELCDKSFTSQYGYQVHLKRHQGIHPYTCEVCGKGMSSKTNKDEHMRHHTGETLNCENCSRTFITHRAYKTHILSCK